MVPPVSPVRFTKNGDDVALDASGDCGAVTVVVPLDSVDDVPHVKVIVLDAPFEVPVPLMVAVVSKTLEAGSVDTVGGTTDAGVVNDRIEPWVVLFPPLYVPLTLK